MDPELKDEWVAALRSGEYPQGNGKLNVDGKYCCLGVLCELLVKQGTVEEYDSNGAISYGMGNEYNGTILTQDIVRIAGLTSPTGRLPTPVIWGGKAFHSLSGLNDSGASFTEIANIIEVQF